MRTKIIGLGLAASFIATTASAQDTVPFAEVATPEDRTAISLYESAAPGSETSS